MARRRLSWTAKQQDKLHKVMAVLDDLSDYKPLTLRQIYYQLVSKEYIENTVSQYGMLSNLLKWARIDGYVAWEDVEDRVRAFHNSEGYTDSQEFLESVLPRVFSLYKRDLWQTQDSYVEAWIEKDALSSVFRRACDPYGISVVVCRGFSSVSFLRSFKNRIDNHEGRDPVMLYFGDFDPSGVEMLTAMKTTLKEELGAGDIIFKRVALLKDDIFDYSLPHNPGALKKTDTRTKKHVALYGELAVELDALRPDVLEEKIKAAIEAEITDHQEYRSQVVNYQREAVALEDLKHRIMREAGI